MWKEDNGAQGGTLEAKYVLSPNTPYQRDENTCTILNIDMNVGVNIGMNIGVHFMQA